MDIQNKNYIFLHGLGQTAASWDKVSSILHIQNPICPDLFQMLEGGDINYPNLYRQFEKTCNGYSGRLDICGISLGAVLALNYALKHLQKVHSLVLIAPQYKMPKGILYIQDIVFHFMPEAMFSEMGIPKKDVLSLTKSMLKLDFQKELNRLTCPVMITCGERDKANQKAAASMHNKIPGSKLYFIENTGHEVNVKAPEELASLIKKFWINNSKL